jgi:hypothetical protein
MYEIYYISVFYIDLEEQKHFGNVPDLFAKILFNGRNGVPHKSQLLMTIV